MLEWLRVHYPAMVAEQQARLKVYEREGQGHSYGPGSTYLFNPEEKQMKKCHACGQKLPLKVGDVVEGEGVSGVRHKGTVVVLPKMTGLPTPTSWIDVIDFAGVRRPLRAMRLVRLHGYYRITEREPLA